MPKISELTLLSSLDGADSIPIVDDTDDTTKYTTIQNLVDNYMNSRFLVTDGILVENAITSGVNARFNTALKDKTFDLTSGSLTTDYTDNPVFTVSTITNADSSKTVTLQSTLELGIHTFINESVTDTVDIVLPGGGTFIDSTSSKTLAADSVYVIFKFNTTQYIIIN